MAQWSTLILVTTFLLCGPGQAGRAVTDDSPKAKLASIEARVIKIVADQFMKDPKQVTRSTKLVKDLGADDLDRVELVLELEEAFEITIEDDDAEKFQTVGQMIDHVTKALRARKP